MRSSVFARLFRSAAVIETHEIKGVLLSVLYFFLLFGSYSIIKPVRDAMGTVYGMADIEELFTGTFVASLIFAGFANMNCTSFAARCIAINSPGQKPSS